MPKKTDNLEERDTNLQEKVTAIIDMAFTPREVDVATQAILSLIAEERKRAVREALEKVALRWGETVDEAAANVLEELISPNDTPRD